MIAKRIVLSATWSLGSRIVAQGITFLTTVYLAKLLGTGEFGTINFGWITIGLVDNIVDFGFGLAIIREKNLNNVQLSSCFWFLSVLCVLALGILNMYAIFAITDVNYSEVIRVLVFGLLFVPHQTVMRALASRDLKLDSVARYELFGGLLRNGSALAGAYFGYGVFGFVYGYLIERLVITTGLAYLTKWMPRLQFSMSSLRPFISFGMANIASRVIWYLSTKIDSLFIGLYFGKDALGLYSLALQISYFPFQLVTTSLHRVIYATFAKFSGHDEFSAILRKTAWWLLAGAAPVCVGIFAIAEPMAGQFFGEKWEGLAALLEWLSLAGLVQIYASMWPQFWNAVGRPGYGVLVNAISLVILALALYTVASAGAFADVAPALLMVSVWRLLVVCTLSKRLIRISFMRIGYESLFPVIGCLLIVAWCKKILPAMMSGNDLSTLAGMILGSAILYGTFLAVTAVVPFLPIKKLILK